MPTFFIQKNSLQKGRAFVRGDDAKHITKTLRMKSGQTLQISDGEKLYWGEIEVHQNEVEILIKEELPRPDAPHPLHLYLALIKLDKMEWIVQKAVELNISSIQFLSSHYSNIKEISPKKWQRLQKLSHEAQKQCGRLKELELKTVIDFKEAAKNNQSRALIPHHLGDNRKRLHEIVEKLKEPYSIWIGPEGGWHEEEIDLAIEHKFHPISLGSLIMRAETAALYSMSYLSEIIKSSGTNALDTKTTKR